MKITINVPMTTTTAVVEGNTEDIKAIVTMLINNAKPIDSITKKPSSTPKPSTIQTPSSREVRVEQIATDGRSFYEVKGQQLTGDLYYSNYDADHFQKIALRFISSIYVYAPSKTITNGRGRYIAEILADGNYHIFRNLIKASNGTTASIMKVATHLRNSGATVSINRDTANPLNSTIAILSVPNKNFTPRVRKDSGKPRNSVKTRTDKSVSTALSGKRV